MADPQWAKPARHLLLKLGDPEVVHLAVFNDRMVFIDLPLLQRVWVGGDCPHLSNLQGHTHMHTIVKKQKE